MYICPTCKKQFDNPEDVAKHSLKCWREHNPNHKSKSAPHSEDVMTRNIDLFKFFEGFPAVCRK